MAENNNAICSICGNSYHLCLSCKDKMKLHPWKVYCCSVDCYKVSQVVRGFSTGAYTKDEFKSKLKNIDLSNLDTYKEHIKTLIKDALKEDKVVVETAEKIEKTGLENVTEVNVKETETAENVIEPIVSRKRNFKVNDEVEKAE